MGWKKTLIPEKADLIIVNSCGFIEPAKAESIEAVITARTAYPAAKILLAGCLAERYGEVFKDELQEADAFFGNGDLSKLPEIVAQLFPEGKGAVQSGSSPESGTGFRRTIGIPASPQPVFRPFLKPPQEGVCSGLRPEVLNFPRSAFIKITEGCNNYCTFCAIPIIRGAVRSRPAADITGEIQSFVNRGYKEFNLIGQDLAAYEIDTPFHQSGNAETSALSGLAQLLIAISRIEGSFTVRLLYIHPDHFPLDILPVMVHDSRFLPYFDIPFQSGSAPIIRAMNRCGSPETYRQLVDTIRAAFRDAESPYGEAVIRTTFLTGFPGETQEDFERTAAFLHEVGSLWAGAFAYSREEGTPAARMKKQIPSKIAEQRKTLLNELQLKITEKKLAAFCGQELEVLIEELIPQAEDEDGCIALGRAWFQAPEVDGAVVVNFSEEQKDSEGNAIAAGSLVRVRITTLRGIDLEAVVV